MGILCSCFEHDESLNDRYLIEDWRSSKFPDYRSRCIPLKSWNAKFLYTIIQWKTNWLDNPTKTQINTILGNKYELIPMLEVYDDYNTYKKTMEPLMILELFHSLQNDKNLDDDPDTKKSDRKLVCNIKTCQTITIDQCFNFKKLVIEEVIEKDGEYNYPLVGDLLIVEYTNQLKVLGYVENIEKYWLTPSGKIENVFTIIIKNISIELGEITITTIKSMHINLRMLLALYDLPKSSFLPLILKPNHLDYRSLEADIDTILPLMFEQQLNDKQTKIVANIVSTVNYNLPKICLIHGPPGTGKSTVIISIITELMKVKKTTQNDMRILLCSSSNFAVDSVLIKLLDVQSSLENNGIKLNIIRIGRNDKIDGKVKSVTFPRPPMRITAEDHKREKNFILNADIIATTLGACYSNKMERLFSKETNQQIQVCIVDEAGQSTEIETLIPLMLGIKLLVLVGDPKQLPPTIISQIAKGKGMDKSLFARAQKYFRQNNSSINPVQFLKRQFRMADEIAKWPNEIFYDGIIENRANNMYLKNNANMHHYKVLSHKYQQSGNDENYNYCESIIIVNLLEVIITELVKLLKIKKISEFPSIGIITPYCDQKKRIEKMINIKWPSDCNNADMRNQIQEVQINTLDSFQGREKDIIIMSCVRTKKLGFFGNPNRLNVGLTRAKQTMIVCGNFESRIFQRNNMWMKLISDAKNRRCFDQVNQQMNYESLKNLIFDYNF